MGLLYCLRALLCVMYHHEHERLPFLNVCTGIDSIVALTLTRLRTYLEAAQLDGSVWSIDIVRVVGREPLLDAIYNVESCNVDLIHPSIMDYDTARHFGCLDYWGGSVTEKTKRAKSFLQNDDTFHQQ
jgi:hypothetical protein